jgi:hypothetical protein
MEGLKCMAVNKSSIDYNRPWTEDEAQQLYSMRRDGLPFNAIGAVLKRTADSCSSKYNRTQWSVMPFYDKVAALKDRAHTQVKESFREKLITAGETKAARYRLQSEVVADALVSAVKTLPPVKYKVYKGPSQKTEKKHESEDVGLMLSDIHIGHSHTFEETGGLSEYNKDIFLKRSELLKKGIVDIVELHSHLYDLPNLHIFCLGDIVAGMNAVGQWSHTFIDTDIMQQWAMGTSAIADMIYYWLGMFDKIYFYGVRGNHGRVAPHGIEKDVANWDILSYLMLEQMFKDNARVVFNIPRTWWMRVDIKSHKFLLVHGDDVKGRTAILGLSNFVNKWVSVADFVPNYTLAGHFHSAAELSTPQGRLFINGSFIGGDVYSLKTIHDAARPEQKIFGIHNRRGVTWVYNIDLREESA